MHFLQKSFVLTFSTVLPQSESFLLHSINSGIYIFPLKQETTIKRTKVSLFGFSVS